ncbi:MAG: 16S rRNA (uracil(1498)-N(3))-methyltransferase [candidate division WOR-3 bacterium]|nr:MAG: 16S rRNA (uracil(1498)-N(3))-methyltransferase [candidate division WOR-3 bacterium]
MDIVVRGPEVHHIRNVMRKTLGEVLMLTDGRGHTYRARIDSWNKTSIKVRVVDREFHEQEQQTDIACAFVPLKSTRSDFIIEKCTELGVSHFYTFVSRRAVVRRVSRARVEHFQRLARSAMLQSRRYYLPDITVCADTDQLTKHFRGYDLVLCADAHGKKDIPCGAKKMLYIVGPEGGFDDRELTLFKKHGVHFISLDDHRLRSETAAIVSAVKLFDQNKTL